MILMQSNKFLFFSLIRALFLIILSRRVIEIKRRGVSLYAVVQDIIPFDKLRLHSDTDLITSIIIFQL